MIRPVCAALVTLVIGFLGDQFAGAQTWDGLGINNNFSTASNWSPVAPPVNDGTANLTFSGSTRLSPNADVPWSVHSVSFSSTGGAFTVGGSPLTIGAGGITDSQTSKLERIASSINLSADQTWSSMGLLLIGTSGSTVLNNNGFNVTMSSGNMQLFGTFSGSGALTVNAGIIDASPMVNSSTGALNLNGGIFEIRSISIGTSNSPININGGNVQSLESNIPINRNIVIGSNGATFSANTQGSGPVINGNVSGPGTLTVSTRCYVTLTGTNSYSGGTQLQGGTLICTTSTLQGDVSISNFAEGGTLAFAQNVDGSYSGNISSVTPVAGSDPALQFAGTGVVSLGGSNNYYGLTLIAGGVGSSVGHMRLLNSSALSPNSVVFLGVNSSLDLNGFNATAADIYGNGGTVQLGTGSLTVGGDNLSYEFPGSFRERWGYKGWHWRAHVFWFCHAHRNDDH